VALVAWWHWWHWWHGGIGGMVAWWHGGMVGSASRHPPYNGQGREGLEQAFYEWHGGFRFASPTLQRAWKSGFQKKNRSL